MYLPLLSEQEQKAVVRALRGPEFIRKNHGSLYDRGSADSHYGRMPSPHYGGVGGDSGPRVEVYDEASVAEYLAGYEYNERYGDKKDWR
jgi:hypothetical protein